MQSKFAAEYHALSEENKLGLRGACLKCPASKRATGNYCEDHRYTRAAKCSVMSCGKQARSAKPGMCYCARHVKALNKTSPGPTKRRCKYCGENDLRTKVQSCGPCFSENNVCPTCKVKPAVVRNKNRECFDCSGIMNCVNYDTCKRRLCKGMNGYCRKCAKAAGRYYCVLCKKRPVGYNEKFCNNCMGKKPKSARASLTTTKS